MADEGLTFRFVFQDDSPGATAGGSPSSPPSPAAPPEAAPGAAARANPAPPPSAAPAPRRPPPDTPPTKAPTSTNPGQAAAAEADESPAPADQPRRRRPRSTADEIGGAGSRDNPRGEASPVGNAGPRARAPRAPRPSEVEQRKSGEAAKLLNDLVHHLQQVPGIGRAIGSLYHVVSPLIEGFQRVQRIRRDEARKREAGQPQPVPAPRQPPTQPAPAAESRDSRASGQPPEQPPMPRPPLPPLEDRDAVPRAITIMPPGVAPPVARRPVEAPPPAESHRPVDRPNPDDQFPVRSFRTEKPEDRKPREPQPPLEKAPEPREPPPPSGFRVAPDPDAAAAMQKLIAALGPLPEDSKALREAVRPLTGLGYTLAELVSAVRTMRHADEEQAPGVEGARPASGGTEPPESPPADAGHGSRAPRQPRAPQPPPPPNGQTPIPRAGPPPVQQQPAPRPPQPPDNNAPPPPSPGGAAQAAAGLAPVAGAAFGPEGLVAGIAAVAVVGAATRAFTALVNTVRAVDRLFTDLSHRLAPFNGKLAAAEANAQVSQLMGDIRQARAIGPELAEFTKERSRMDRSLQRIETSVEKFALGNFVNPLLKGLNDLADGTSSGFEWLKDFASKFSEDFDAAAATASADAKAVKRELERQRKEKEELEAADIMGIFFGDKPGHLRIGGVDFGDINKPIMPAPIVPGPGVPPGAGIQ